MLIKQQNNNYLQQSTSKPVVDNIQLIYNYTDFTREMNKTTTMTKRKTTTSAPMMRWQYTGCLKESLSTSLLFHDENSSLTVGKAKLHSSTIRT